MTAVDPTEAAVARPLDWPVPSEESERLFARANLVSPGGVQGGHVDSLKVSRFCRVGHCDFYL